MELESSTFGTSHIHICRSLSFPSRVLQHFRMNTMVYGWVSVIASLFILVGWFGLPWALYPVLLFTAFLASGGRNFPKIFFKTVLRDFRAVMVLYRYIEIPAWLHHRNNTTIPDLFQATVARHPHKAAFLFEGKTWTFQDVEDYSNRIANYFRSCGYKKGDVIALFMESCPEFVCMWLGLAKIGVVSSLINFNLRLDSLIHCIKVCNAKAIIFGTELTDAVQEIEGKLPKEMMHYSIGRLPNSVESAKHLNQLLSESPTMPPKSTGSKSFQDVLFYIYTSGTTGLPKPAVIRHSRFFQLANAVIGMFRISNKDVNYCTLPLYHSAGGILGVGSCFLAGATLAIRRKFSASRFWDECVECKATMTQYIGELCRYLLAQPVRPAETKHSLRLAMGNGLKPQIWKSFQSRFNIGQIGEFYGATEGNASLVNPDNTVGACGFLSVILPKAYPVTLIKVNPETGDMLRGSDGLAIKCNPGQPGLVVAKIRKSATQRFDGYLNQKETSKKIAHDVLTPGDSVFLTGDVLVQDEYGYMYFQDRTGDTFRWRGENVSTAEVEAILSNLLGLRDVVAYGVEIPGSEGRAGMAAIVDPKGEVDLGELGENIKKSLPSYARPVFLRIVHEVDTTGTFKLQKMKLRKEGFDAHKIDDELFVLDSKSGQYSSLDDIKYNRIMTGELKL